MKLFHKSLCSDALRHHPADALEATIVAKVISEIATLITSSRSFRETLEAILFDLPD